ncbi:hypothetical protein [Tropicimonas sp. IMCC34011]|uniref:hypothetical protein n=1 Tax=Tropicimonas sp. IMCC34011 TaxID=2248759 RepID=UPI000E26D7CD|nr:hypothetical protein [Tropicimonas sp. IMCC34011]
MTQSCASTLSRPRSGPDIFVAVNAAALPRLETLCRTWAPGGVTRGAEYLALNPTRNDRSIGSFCINIRTGRWSDFATGDAGGDPISLYAYLHGLKQIDAARRLALELGVAA